MAQSCTARRSAPTPCSSGAGQGSGSSRPPGFAMCWKCAAATGAGSGDFGATSSRLSTATCGWKWASERSQTEPFAAASMQPRSGPRQSCCSSKGRKASRFSSSTPTPIPRMSAARSPRFARYGQTNMSRRRMRSLPRSGSSSASRPLPSMPTCSRSSAPTSASSKHRCGGIALMGNLGRLPPPLWGRVGEGGGAIRNFNARILGPPPPAPPHRGEGSTLSARQHLDQQRQDTL